MTKYAAYIIRPHAQPRLSGDGTPIYIRFSCVGFVVEAYRDAGLNVVVTDEANLPAVDLATLAVAYPELAAADFGALLNRRYHWGCDGNGPWPVLMPGHLFHALAKIGPGERDFLPYVPKKDDERFF
jgi:hypothetical protein